LEYGSEEEVDCDGSPEQWHNIPLRLGEYLKIVRSKEARRVCQVPRLVNLLEIIGFAEITSVILSIQVHGKQTYLKLASHICQSNGFPRSRNWFFSKSLTVSVSSGWKSSVASQSRYD
jgi:hypothetical protein